MTVWIQNPFDNLPSEGYRKQRYWLMCEAFARAGHQVVFWTSSFSHARKGMRDEGSGIRGQGIEVRLIPTLPYPKNVCFARIHSHRAYAREWLTRWVDAPGAAGGGTTPSCIGPLMAARDTHSQIALYYT